MDALRFLDTQLFLVVNGVPHTPMLDSIAQTLSGLGSAGFIFIILALALFIRKEGKDRRFLISFVATFGIVLALSELFLKTQIARMRPDALVGALIVGTAPETYSFPSTHTMLAFAGAALLSWKEPRWCWVWYGLAGLIGWSRIYLGYHYPIDVLAGALLGYGLAKGVIALTTYFYRNPRPRLFFGKKRTRTR